MCGSRRELSNEYLLAKVGFDTAENEPLKVHLLSNYPALGFNFHQAAPLLPAGKQQAKQLASFGRTLLCFFCGR